MNSFYAQLGSIGSFLDWIEDDQRGWWCPELSQGLGLIMELAHWNLCGVG